MKHPRSSLTLPATSLLGVVVVGASCSEPPGWSGEAGSKSPYCTGEPPRDTAEGTAEDACSAALDARVASEGGEWVVPEPVPACDSDAPRTYEDAAAAWGLQSWADPDAAHNRGGVAAVADFDDNGLPDVILGYEDHPLRLLMNKGSGFEATVLTGTQGSGPVALGDWDGDGDLDGLSIGPPIHLLRNNAGSVQPEPIVLTGLTAPVDFVPGDFDGDGDLDAYVVTAGAHGDDPAARQDEVLWNDGRGGFSEGSVPLPASGGLGFEGVALDADADGDLDVYVVNDFGTSLGPNALWENRGAGVFVDDDACACDLAVSGMGSDAADLNGDGLPEVHIAATGQNHLLQRDASGAYVDIGAASGIDPLRGLPTMAWGTVFFDHDDDGDLDLVVAEGDFWAAGTDPALRDAYEAPLHLMDHKSGLTFEDVGEPLGLAQTGSWRAVVPADFNGDGQVDLLITDITADPLLLLATGCTGHQAVTVDAPHHARVEACVGGERVVRWSTTESSWGGSKPLGVRIGLGTHPAPEHVAVFVP